MDRTDGEEDAPLLAPMETPPVSGMYTVDSYGDWLNKPVYLPDPEEIRDQCEIIRSRIHAYESKAGSLKGLPASDYHYSPGIREYWRSDVYGRHVLPEEPDLFDSEYWGIQ